WLLLSHTSPPPQVFVLDLSSPPPPPSARTVPAAIRQNQNAITRFGKIFMPLSARELVQEPIRGRGRNARPQAKGPKWAGFIPRAPTRRCAAGGRDRRRGS